MWPLTLHKQLLRSKQLTIGDAVLTAPTNFLFLPLVVRKPEQFQPPLNKHLVSSWPESDACHYCSLRESRMTIFSFHIFMIPVWAMLTWKMLMTGCPMDKNQYHPLSESQTLACRRKALKSMNRYFTGWSIQHDSKTEPVQALRILGETSKTVTANADVIRYQQDIVSFLRLSRAVAGGISPKTNNHFSKLAKLVAKFVVPTTG